MNQESSVRIPQQTRSIEKREQLLKAGTELFSEKGFQATTAKLIARRAGVSVGTFYAYFPDKKALLMDILGGHMAEVDNAVFPPIKAMMARGATCREIMDKIIELGHQSHHHAPGLLRILLGMRHLDGDFARFAREHNDALIARLTRFLDTVGDRLRVTDTEAAARVVANAFEETMHTVALSPQGTDPRRIYAALSDMAATYLFKDPDGPF